MRYVDRQLVKQDTRDPYRDLYGGEKSNKSGMINESKYEVSIFREKKFLIW